VRWKYQGRYGEEGVVIKDKKIALAVRLVEAGAPGYRAGNCGQVLFAGALKM